jgi:hypothetical protein
MRLIRTHWKIIIISLYAIATSAILVSYFFHTQEISTQQTEKLAQSQNKIRALSSQLEKLASASEEAKRVIPTLHSEISDLKSHVTAFAKQAAACATIKKQLNIKE